MKRSRLARDVFEEVLTGPSGVIEQSLPSTISVKDFLSPYSAQLVTEDGAPAGLLESTVPMTSDAAATTAIDLDLHRERGDFVTDETSSSLELPLKASDGATLVEARITLEGLRSIWG